MRAFVAAVLLAIPSRSPLLAQDRLTPERNFIGDDEYAAKIRDVFASARHDAVIEVAFVPSFKPERIAGIRKTKAGFEAFVSKPSSQIWLTYRYRDFQSLDGLKEHVPSRFEQITVHNESRPISRALTKRIRRVFREMLSNAQTPKEPRQIADGEDYHFSMHTEESRAMNARVTSPEHGNARALADLAHALADYARHDAGEEKLLEMLQPLERNLGK